MKRAMFALCAVVSILVVSGCQVDDTDDSKGAPELVIVSERMSDAQRYNIDLTRDDAIYFIAPALDASRLTVTCPSRAVISFDEYIVTRINPTGVKYDPTANNLRLANALITSFGDAGNIGVAAKNGAVEQSCVVDCWDGGSKEQCIVC